MKKIWILLCMGLFSHLGVAAQETNKNTQIIAQEDIEKYKNVDLALLVKNNSIDNQFKDLGSTAVGLSMGAVEANPLGLALLGVKYVAAQEIEKEDKQVQPYLWNNYGAFANAAFTNNLCIIASIATGGAFAPVCPIIGAIKGYNDYNEQEKVINKITFIQMCAKQKELTPEITCVYNE